MVSQCSPGAAYLRWPCWRTAAHQPVSGLVSSLEGLYQNGRNQGPEKIVGPGFRPSTSKSGSGHYAPPFTHLGRYVKSKTRTSPWTVVVAKTASKALNKATVARFLHGFTTFSTLSCLEAARNTRQTREAQGRAANDCTTSLPRCHREAWNWCRNKKCAHAPMGFVQSFV